MKSYIKELKDIFSKVQSRDNQGRVLSLDKSIERITHLVISGNKKGNKVMLVGNGGSASIASHIATDLLKNAEIRAMAFNDPSLITCLANDLGYEYVFQKPIEMFVKKGDILFAISSSGKSKNILNAAKVARDKNCFLITLSGFDKENPLRKLGGINFYAPSNSYGCVEIAHLAICHCIVDRVVENKKTNG